MPLSAALKEAQSRFTAAIDAIDQDRTKFEQSVSSKLDVKKVEEKLHEGREGDGSLQLFDISLSNSPQDKKEAPPRTDDDSEKTECEYDDCDEYEQYVTEIELVDCRIIPNHNDGKVRESYFLQ